jgi:DNA-directed RNA polymerase specialized sigma subunit
LTKFDLRKLKDLNREIEILKKQMDNITVKTNMVSDTVTGSSPFFPFCEHTIKITGIDIEGYERKVNRIRKEQQKRIDELLNKVKEIKDFISQEPDSEMRAILECRYVDCLTWGEIAEEMHMCERTVRRKHRKWWDEN